METSHLAAFVAAVRSGSISRAAKECFVVQTTLGRQIETLEADLGATLLERGSRGVALTPAGTAFLPHAEAVLAAVDEAKRAVRRS